MGKSKKEEPVKGTLIDIENVTNIEVQCPECGYVSTYIYGGAVGSTDVDLERCDECDTLMEFDIE